MKTLLCVIAAIAFLALPVLAEDVKMTFDGSRLAAGYMDSGATGNTTPGTFVVPDAKVRFNVAFDADTSAVLRLNFNNATANGADYAYIKVANVIKKLAKNDMVNPDIYVGLMKINFGEETWSNNPVENALVNNSQADLGGTDMGIEFRDNSLPIELPVTLGYSLSFMNGGYNTVARGNDENNVKAYNLKVMATMKSMPLYFSLSQHDSGALPATSSAALNNAPCVYVGPWYMKGYELDARFDMLEGAQKFDPSKAPLFADAKGVFRLAYGSFTQGDAGATTGSNTTIGTLMLDAIYNVDKQWYVAFRYSYTDVDVKGVTTGDVGKTTRMSIGGGHRLSDNSTLKLDYTTNTEADTALNPKLENDSVSLLMTVKW
jgi:hypothetical protein